MTSVRFTEHIDGYDVADANGRHLGMVKRVVGDLDMDGRRTNLEIRWLAYDAYTQPVPSDRPWGRFRTRADAVAALLAAPSNADPSR